MEHAGGKPHAPLNRPAGIRAAQILLVLLALEGAVALAGSLSTPSMGRRAFLWGYSIPRLAVALSLAVAFIGLASLAVWAFKRPTGAGRLLGVLDPELERNPARLPECLGFLLYLSATGSYFLALFLVSSASNAPYLLRVAVDHMGMSLWWLVSIPFQILLVLSFLCRDRIGPQVVRAPHASGYALLYIAVLGGTLQCITLLLRADVLFSIPGWFWESVPARVRPQQLMPIAIGIVALAGVRRILENPHARLRNMVISILLLYLLQLAFGIAAGGGFESLRLKYSSAPISWETRSACEYPGNAFEVVLNYEENFAEDFWLGTKPPGLLAGLVVAKGLMRSLRPDQFGGIEACKHAMTTVYAYVLPLVAAIALLPMLGLEKTLGDGENPHLSAILYIGVPSVLLMPLIRDQFLFPLLFMLTLLVLGKSIVRRSYVLGIVTGILIYVSVFFSFSLLPLVAVAISWPLIETLGQRRSLDMRRALALVGAVIVGIAVAWVAGRILLGYDPVLRYTAGMDQHRAIKGYTGDLASLWQYAKLNLLEFSISVGFPFVLLIALAGLESLVEVARGRVSPRSAFSVALLICFVAMNIVGQTRGEVARLWLFLVAPFSIVAAGSLCRLPQSRNLGVQVVFATQLMIAMATYMNMDFR